MELNIELKEVNKGASISINGVSVGIIGQLLYGVYSWQSGTDYCNILSLVNDNIFEQIINVVFQYVMISGGKSLLINISEMRELVSEDTLVRLGFTVDHEIGCLEKKIK